MKKVLLLCMAICLLSLGCEKEGVYNPNKKIKKISVGIDKRLREEWTWDKNLLQKIDYYFGGDEVWYTENFKYDNKNRIIRVEDTEYGDYYIISYNKDGYEKIEYYDEDILYMSAGFQYEKKKVSRIDVTYYDDYDDYKFIKNDGFITKIISKEILNSVNESKKKSRAKGNYAATVKFKFTGDNVSEMEVMDDYDTYNITYENYDKNLNPFYSFLNNVVDFEDGAGLHGLSKNNVGKVIYIWGDDWPNDTVEYKYTYDGKYPIQIQISDTKYLVHYEYY